MRILLAPFRALRDLAGGLVAVAVVFFGWKKDGEE